MKRVALMLSLVLATGIAFAEDKAAPAGKTHEAKAQVVSVDAAAKTITVKGEAGQPDKTIPAMGAAVDSLKTVKAGDMVMLTCQDNDKGEHQGVTAITPAK